MMKESFSAGVDAAIEFFKKLCEIDKENVKSGVKAFVEAMKAFIEGMDEVKKATEKMQGKRYSG